MAGPQRIEWTEFDAVLFDLDGVLTPTAEIHERAWTAMFNGFVDSLPQPGTAPFTSADYLAYVDGRPRFDGVRAFLAARGIALPEGDPTDAPGLDTVGALGNRKNEMFGQVLRSDGIDAYPGSLAVLDLLEGEGIGMAVVSSSRNAPEVLRAARLDHRFAVVVDGNVALEVGLAGKPAPDMFIEAAARLAVAPDRAVVVEDALSGVAAGRAGRFALVVGVDRGAGAGALIDSGADIVVGDLAETIGPR